MVKATTTTSTREVVTTVTESLVNLELTEKEAQCLRLFLGSFDIRAVELDGDKTLDAIFDALYVSGVKVDWDIHKSYTKKVNEYVARRTGTVL